MALRVFPHKDVILPCANYGAAIKQHISRDIVMEQPLYSEGSVSHITFAR